MASGHSEQFDENDLFGPKNAEYQRTSVFSRYRPPSSSQGTRQKRDYNDDGTQNPPKLLRNGHYRSNVEPSEPRRPQNQATWHSQNPSKDLVAFLKLGPVGHQDTTLRLVCPPIQKPAEVSHYSRASDGSVFFDDRCLRRLKPNMLHAKGMDLNEGFHSYVPKKEDDEDSDSNPFHTLLHCLRMIKYPLGNVHFVTFRNNLNKILGAAYQRDEDWEMGVHKRGVTVYLHVHKTSSRTRVITEKERRFEYFGYAYERLVTESRWTGGGSGLEEEGEAVDANVEYCSVLKTKLGAHRIIMGAEIDCYDKDHNNQRYYVELKTSKEFMNNRNVETFEKYKLLKFWIQSFLAGVPRIIVGFRDDTGRVVRSESMTLKDITERVKHNSYWEGGACLAFADKVLCWLYGSLTEDREDCVLRFVSAANRLELSRSDSCPEFIEQHCEMTSRGK